MTEDHPLNRRAVVRVSVELLADALHLPEGTTLLGAQWNHTTRDVELFVSHESLPLIPVGCPCPPINVEITRVSQKGLDGRTGPIFKSRYLA
jgi:hypothetical protein